MMNPNEVSVLMSEEQIQERVATIGAELTQKFAGKDLLAVGVLKGSFMFFSDLIRAIDTDISCDFLGVSSYKGTRSTGEVKVTLDMTSSIKDRHILLIEDIVDTGLTMNYLKNTIMSREPASLTTASLLFKPKALKVDCTIDYTGFEIGNDFVVGYGLDYQDYYRNLPYVGVLQNIN